MMEVPDVPRYVEGHIIMDWAYEGESTFPDYRNLRYYVLAPDQSEERTAEIKARSPLIPAGFNNKVYAHTEFPYIEWEDTKPLSYEWSFCYSPVPYH